MAVKLAYEVGYAATVVYELRAGSTEEDPMIRMIFRNGTTDDFHTYNMFGQSGDIPLSLFKSKLEFAAVNDTADWCIVCANSADRGCGTCDNPGLAAAAASSGHHERLSNAASGVIGAAVTAAAFFLALGLLFFFGVVSFTLKPKRGRRSSTPVSLF